MADGIDCPRPHSASECVLLAHGGGGRLMQELLEGVFRPAFSNPELDRRHDSAVFEIGDARLAFTTDSYVVQPLFFAGGDIGSLAVYGTVNDLAMAGARPLWLSAGFILEEGLPLETLRAVVASMEAAAKRANVRIVTGDTKVVNRGKGDGLFINTAGVGVVEAREPIGPERVRAGDAVVVSGDLGRHGIAVMAGREGLNLETAIESDSGPVADIVLDLLREGLELHCLRDLTRGGLASALNEIAQAAGVSVVIGETVVPVRDDVAAVCELLGFDPLYVANEGRLVAFVPEAEAERAVAVMRRHEMGSGAVVLGTVADSKHPQVVVRSAIGGQRLLDMLSGEQLPRIC